ncbi:hypothetical protein AVE30378_02193 [Achromobacter veterisilvae]|uniref:Uncharacterized protein n=1 Tax=Achromobacter veterisilvae TaxID=2069367 RepID=A0A446CFI9_9BURK|nr:hypothetical protein [Achromobacter veterisilvae]SSW66654.1 hypothetical protein AVE30378_02193 [Achromobacter veterisilvae]
MNDIQQLAAALGNRDWKWWDSCSFRRLTFEDGPDRRDGGALHGTVHPFDQHPDVAMAPGVREFIEAASPQAIGRLCEQLARAASHLQECAHVIGQERPDPMRTSRAYADAMAFLVEIGKVPEAHSMAHKYCASRIYESLIEQDKE